MEHENSLSGVLGLAYVYIKFVGGEGDAVILVIVTVASVEPI